MSSEIKAIIFDMGGVLLDFSQKRCIYPFFDNEEDAKYIQDIIFKSGDWALLDRGSTTEEEMIAKWKKMTPAKYHKGIDKVMSDWHKNIPPVPHMAELMKELIKNGYKCYLLSNASVHYEVFKNDFESLRLLSGYIVSAFWHVMKPEAEIYRILLNEFSLKAEECFFIDDVEANINGAKALSIRGYQFATYDVEALKLAMRKEGIHI